VQRLAGFHDKWHIIPALIIDKEHCDSKGLGDAALGHSRVQPIQQCKGIYHYWLIPSNFGLVAL